MKINLLELITIQESPLLNFRFESIYNTAAYEELTTGVIDIQTTQQDKSKFICS